MSAPDASTRAPASARSRLVPVRWTVHLSTVERKYLLLSADLLLVNLALIGALTASQDFVPSLATVLDSAKWFVTLSVVWLGCGILFDVYNQARAGSASAIVAAAGPSVILTTLLYPTIPWLTPPISHRSYPFAFLLFTLAGVITWRVVYATVLCGLPFRQRALIVGTGELAQKLARDLEQAETERSSNPFRGTGYHVLGLVAASGEAETPPSPDLPVLGNVQQLVRLAREYQADEIILATDELQSPDWETCDVLLDCRELGFLVSPVSTVFERLTARLPVAYARYDLGVMLGRPDSPNNRLYLAVKALIDFLLALAALPVLLLVMGVVAIANAIWSPGPLFYLQQRVGRGGSSFKVIKFRSMVVEAESNTGAIWSSHGDPRITPVGRPLRRTRLDELPQIINVLRGEMSWVGPRPERPSFVGELCHQFPLYRARHAVKPGITGWAQIRHRYASSVEDSRAKLEYDLYYVKHASLYLDLLILLQTIRVMVGLQGR